MGAQATGYGSLSPAARARYHAKRIASAFTGAALARATVRLDASRALCAEGRKVAARVLGGDR
jgi:hypothetical protein